LRRRCALPGPFSLEQVLEAEADLVEAGAPREHLHQRVRAVLGHLDLDLAIVEAPVAQHGAELLAGRDRRRREARAGRARRSRDRRAARQEQIEQSLLGVVAGARAAPGPLLVAHQLHRDLDQIAHDRLDVAADVADLGELRRLDLENGARASLARRRAISVLPTPVGPIRMMFFGAISSRRSPSVTCWRRQRLRSAMATARLASRWPTM
jgi:hypothetical protein